jgi:thiol:disulfide interchange protein DsbC
MKPRYTRTTLSVLIAVLVLLTAAVAVCHAAAPPTPAEVEARFRTLLRDTKITSVTASAVPGLYEVVAGPNVFYVALEGKGYLIAGQIIDSDGKNLTAGIRQALHDKELKTREQAAAVKLPKLNLALAVKLGSGPNTIIEFTDPDCPYCRKLDEFLAQRSDVTRHVFLNPIDQLHPNARAKAVFILNSVDKAAALREVFSGKYDSGPLPIATADIGKYPDAVKKLAAGMEAGRDLGVEGTPLLFVNGSMVEGADTERITQLLKK